MIELPEAKMIAKDLRKTVLNKKISNVIVKQSPHNFAFFLDNIDNYNNLLIDKKITQIVERNFYVELVAEDISIIMRDGVNIRYINNKVELPIKHQFLLEFEDNSYLVATVAMYACFGVFKTGTNENIYYQKELEGISPVSSEFDYNYFLNLIDERTNKMSAKAFLATEQRILGVGNGVVQDILFNAKIHPKRKINTLNDKEIKNLFDSLKKTLKEMIQLGGRDTEKNIFNESGNYKTLMSKKNLNNPCPKCKGIIKKENYLGGSIYYCPICQIK